jgi:hypothetical protein
MVQVPSIDDTVQLLRDIPELELRQGDRGVVRSTWFAPAAALEVEFPRGFQAHTRALIMAENVQLSACR